ncbi:hypothetical protein P700755_003291 [Psychroflexus torquis ATCC 700755]|uniref:Uncharacterized protein n=1 Tax=Psychroflexus torquis (strain ATCC 700755 / CIP 106069 / ACAM 623) TaxID=313595 RepID=K4ILJ0_PSYTT|nr:hypothetical protein P700755_003291 [Psychroflexus torquis ATCC 700755]
MIIIRKSASPKYLFVMLFNEGLNNIASPRKNPRATFMVKRNIRSFI